MVPAEGAQAPGGLGGASPLRPAVRPERRAGSHDGLSIALLPGSREREVRRHLPVMLEAAARIHESRPGALRLPGAQPAHRRTCRANRRPRGGLRARCPGAVRLHDHAHVALPPRACHQRHRHARVRRGGHPHDRLLPRRPVHLPAGPPPRSRSPTSRWSTCCSTADAPSPNSSTSAPGPTLMARAALDLLAEPPPHGTTARDLERAIELLGDPGASRRAAREITELSTDLKLRACALRARLKADPSSAPGRCRDAIRFRSSAFAQPASSRSFHLNDTAPSARRGRGWPPELRLSPSGPM